MHHSPWRAVAFVAAAALMLAACGDDGTTTNNPSESTGSASTAASGAAVSTGSASAAGTLIEVSYKAGKVEGGGRKQVAKGQTVTLRVTADIVDEVHLHGYDKAVDTIVNQPVQIVFKADASGVFEVELEKKGLPLVEIEVK
jgi:hypothetical protein